MRSSRAADFHVRLGLAGIYQLVETLSIREECGVVAVAGGVALHEGHRIVVVCAPSSLADLVLSFGNLVVEGRVIGSSLDVYNNAELCLPLVLIVLSCNLGLVIRVSLEEGNLEGLACFADLLKTFVQKLYRILLKELFHGLFIEVTEQIVADSGSVRNLTVSGLIFFQNVLYIRLTVEGDRKGFTDVLV